MVRAAGISIREVGPSAARTIRESSTTYRCATSMLRASCDTVLLSALDHPTSLPRPVVSPRIFTAGIASRSRMSYDGRNNGLDFV